jgi:hypothetical protein
MRGLITTKHLLVNASTIVQEFGVLAYLRCLQLALFSGRRVTFLECIVRLRRR